MGKVNDSFRHALKSHWRPARWDAVSAIVTAVAAAGVTYIRRPIIAPTSDYSDVVLTALIAGVAGGAVIWCIRFIGHLWLAPAEISDDDRRGLEQAYEKLRDERDALRRSAASWLVAVESSPRIRTKIWRRSAMNHLYEQTQTWGLQIENDGARATFEATVEVSDGPSSGLVLSPQAGRHRVIWERKSGPRTEILNGGDDSFYFGVIAWPTTPGLNHCPHRHWLQYFDERTSEPTQFYECLFQSSPTNEEPFVIVDVIISSDPPMIAGPHKMRYKFGPRELTEITP